MSKIDDAFRSLLAEAIARKREDGARGTLEAVASQIGATWLAEAGGSWDVIRDAVEDLQRLVRDAAAKTQDQLLMEALSGADDGLSAEAVGQAYRVR